MSKLASNIHAFSGNAVWMGSSLGLALPTTLTADPSTLNFTEIGILTDAGVTEGRNVNETQVFDSRGVLVRVVRSQEQRTFTFTALESNPLVNNLLYPGTTANLTGATAEVQTVTITGTPTSGTFNLTLPGYGTASNLAYNITTAALATALTTAFGLAVTVTGTAGSSYVVTFSASAGDVPTMTASGAFVGGTTPTITVAVTTPGVSGTYSRNVAAGVGRYLYPFVVDFTDGTYSERYLINQGEAVQSGDVAKTASAVAEYQFSLTTYPDSNGYFFTRLSTNG